MSVDMTKLVKLNSLDALAQKADAKIQEVETKANDSFKGAKVVNGNTIALYKTTDTTGTADLTLDLPSEMVVDAAKTTFVDSFVFSTETYGTTTTNPNLDGKPVLVLAVKTVDKGVETTSYSFIDINFLVTIYTAADNSITVSGYTIAVKRSAAANNAIELKADGLHVDITGKADRDTDATLHNIAYFDATGTPVDGGIPADTLLVDSDIAPDSDVTSVLSNYFTLDS